MRRKKLQLIIRTMNKINFNTEILLMSVFNVLLSKVRFYFILLVVLHSSSLFGQKPNFQPGTYFTIEQFRTGISDKRFNLNIEKRSGSDITMNGGNEYKITSESDLIKKSTIKKEIYAYVKNDSIFINGWNHKLQTWYGLALTSGNYILFKGCLRNEDAAAFAMAGGLIGGIIASKASDLYILSLRTGNVNYCSIDYLEKRIEENKPDLLTPFKNESQGLKNRELAPVAIKYLNILNEFVSPQPISN